MIIKIIITIVLMIVTMPVVGAVLGLGVGWKAEKYVYPSVLVLWTVIIYMVWFR